MCGIRVLGDSNPFAEIGILVGVLTLIVAIVVGGIQIFQSHQANRQSHQANRIWEEMLSSPMPSPAYTDTPSPPPVTPEPLQTPAPTEPPEYTSPPDIDHNIASAVSLSDMTNIARPPQLRLYPWLPVADNYNNEYFEAFIATSGGTTTFTAILDYEFSSFKATYFVRHGQTSTQVARLTITLDGTVIYRASLYNIDRPVEIDIDISEGNIFTIEITGAASMGAGIRSGLGYPRFVR